jgi:hypothetical protein
MGGGMDTYILLTDSGRWVRVRNVHSFRSSASLLKESRELTKRNLNLFNSRNHEQTYGPRIVILTCQRFSQVKDVSYWTKMVHGRARAPPRQTWRVAVNEGR